MLTRTQTLVCESSGFGSDLLKGQKQASDCGLQLFNFKASDVPLWNVLSQIATVAAHFCHQQSPLCISVLKTVWLGWKVAPAAGYISVDLRRRRKVKKQKAAGRSGGQSKPGTHWEAVQWWLVVAAGDDGGDERSEVSGTFDPLIFRGGRSVWITCSTLSLLSLL